MLGDLLSADNDKRGYAENCFIELKKSNGDQVLLSLVQVLTSSTQPDQIRSLSAVLLRRVLLKDEISLWPGAHESTQLKIKSELLIVLTREQNPSIRRKICDTVGELASGILEDEQWSELLPHIYQWVQSPQIADRENAFRIFEMIAEYLAMLPDVNHLTSIYLGAFQDTNTSVRLHALRAFGMLMLNLSQFEPFYSILPAISQSIQVMVTEGEVDDLQDALEVLIELVETHGLFFKPQLAVFLQLMTTIATETLLPESCRQLAFEFLVCLAENAPCMCRKDPNFVTSAFQIAFQMMLELEDDQDWNDHHSDEDEQDEITNYDVGLEALDRLAGVLGPCHSLPICFELIETFLTQQEDWKMKHTALMGLSQIVEIVPTDQIEPILAQILHYATHSHPRVAFAAVNAIGQLSADHGPYVQETYASQIFPVLINCLSNTTAPRIQAHAAAALVNFVEMCSIELVQPVLNQLVESLYHLIQHSVRFVQEHAITAIAAVAECTEQSFEPYYDIFVPVLKAILSQCHDREDRLLRGKALECLSLIGYAVGREKFRSDAAQVLEFMMQQTHLEADDPQRAYVLQAWARLCKCLEEEFVPYLPVVMPILFQAATQQAEVELDQYPDDEDADEGVEIAQVNDRCVSIRTSVLDDKAMACQMLSSIAGDMKEAFFPYVEQVTKILAPLLTDSVHADIRSASITAMPDLVLSASRALASSVDQSPVYILMEYILGRLVAALTSEPELELVMTILQAIKVTVENAPTAELNHAQLSQIFSAFQMVLGDSMRRRAIQRATLAVDEEDSSEQDELEEELQFVLAESIGGLAKTHPEGFVQTFQHTMLPAVLEMSRDYCLDTDRKFAVFILDDIIEHTAAYDLYECILPILQQTVGSKDPSLRQAAAYGLGMAAKRGQAAERFCQQSLHVVQQALADPQVQDETVYGMANDNVISCFGLICEYHSETVNALEQFPQWLKYLPLRHDQEESKAVIYRLCNMISAKNTYVLGTNGENIPQLLAILAQVASCADLEQDLVLAMVHALRNLSVDSKIMQSSIQSLSPVEQHHLQHILSQ